MMLRMGSSSFHSGDEWTSERSTNRGEKDPAGPSRRRRRVPIPAVIAREGRGSRQPADAARRYWKGDDNLASELGYRLAGGGSVPGRAAPTAPIGRRRPSMNRAPTK